MDKDEYIKLIENALWNIYRLAQHSNICDVLPEPACIIATYVEYFAGSLPDNASSEEEIDALINHIDQPTPPGE